MAEVTILALSGSLRANSFNTALMRAAVKNSSGVVDFDVYEELGDLPLYNQDLDTDEPPAVVADLRRRVAAAGGLLIVTPEHNACVPAALKNAIDWVSTQQAGGILVHKPVAIAGGSPGAFGSARAQTMLRSILASIGADTLSKPEVAVFHCHDRIDETGDVTDAFTLKLLDDLVVALSNRVKAAA
ncbi:NADPH-dependent FMN reductase [Lentzea sp. NPDC055074]